jgi:hypothetical protein
VPALDHVVSSAGIAALRTPAWWHLVNVLQWLSVLVLVGGLGWWGALEVAARTGRFEVPAESFRGYPLHLLLVLGGVVVGVGLGLLSAVANRVAGVRRSRHADRVLRAAVDGVAEEHIIAPVRVELDAYERYRTSIIRARA